MLEWVDALKEKLEAWVKKFENTHNSKSRYSKLWIVLAFIGAIVYLNAGLISSLFEPDLAPSEFGQIMGRLSVEVIIDSIIFGIVYWAFSNKKKK